MIPALAGQLALLGVLGLLFGQEATDPLDRGKRFLEEQKLEAAESVFRELVAKNPQDARAAYYLGIALARQDRTEEAVETLEARDAIRAVPMFRCSSSSGPPCRSWSDFRKRSGS